MLSGYVCVFFPWWSVSFYACVQPPALFVKMDWVATGFCSVSFLACAPLPMCFFRVSDLVLAVATQHLLMGFRLWLMTS